MPTSNSSVRVFAPGGIGNLGPGLDILGCAVTGAGDTLIASLTDHPGVRVDEPGLPGLTTDPSRHASAIAATEVLRRAERSVGVSLRLTKGLPLAGGQGGSAASSAAGAVAMNALLGNPLDRDEVLYAALVAEERIAGRHIDNLAPALYGGIILVHSITPLRYESLPVPEALRLVIVHPKMEFRTADARAVLPQSIDRATAIAQAAAVASMVAAFHSGDLAKLRDAVDDRIAEPARAPLLPGFVDAKRAALDAGALGCSISGGGPSAFAFADSDDAGARIGAAMVAAYQRAGLEATSRVGRVDVEGTRILSE